MNIIKWPDPLLHVKCSNVDTFDDELYQLTQNLVTVMESNNGVGIAAPQVGILKNIFVTYINQTHTVFINPKITQHSEHMFQFTEGCLSVPGYFEDRERPNEITIEYQTVSGKYKTNVFTGLEAFVIQHETDHLAGKVFVDELSPLKLERIQKKIKKHSRLK